MESLNGKLSDELFNREVFETLMGNGEESITRDGLIAPWAIGFRRQGPNSPGRWHWILSLGVDFNGFRI